MTDLLSKEAWMEIEDRLQREWNVNAHAYDAAGSTFTGHSQYANTLCPEIRENPGGLQGICSVAHQFMAKQARDSGKTVIDACDAGLTKICAPVVVDGEFIGILGICGALDEDGEVETFIVEKSTGMTEERAEELAAQVPVLPSSKARELASQLEVIIADAISKSK